MNQFDRFSGQAKYGEVEKARRMVQEVPLSQKPFSIDNVPRKAQKRAASRSNAQQAQPEVQLPPETATPQNAPQIPEGQYPSYLADTWEELASLPDAPPLIKMYAASARKMADRNV
jgi:hypothetical protein